MSGLLGSILEIVNVIGGIVLTILIGRIAWKDSEPARMFRLVFGSVLVGEILGFLNYYYAIYDFAREPGKGPGIKVGSFFMIPMATFVVVLFL